MGRGSPCFDQIAKEHAGLVPAVTSYLERHAFQHKTLFHLWGRFARSMPVNEAKAMFQDVLEMLATRRFF